MLIGVENIYSTYTAFAGVLRDGTVVTWDDKSDGGDSSRVQAALFGVENIYFTEYAFAAVLKDGSGTVVIWGDKY